MSEIQAINAEKHQSPADKPYIKRKVSEIPFRGWILKIGDQMHDATPDYREIEAGVVLAKSGVLEARVFNNTQELANQLAQEAQGDPHKHLALFRTYNANRAAYFVVNGWDKSPIEVMANGDMRDGQHRLLAARYMGLEEVDVIVF